MVERILVFAQRFGLFKRFSPRTDPSLPGTPVEGTQDAVTWVHPPHSTAFFFAQMSGRPRRPIMRFQNVTTRHCVGALRSALTQRAFSSSCFLKGREKIEASKARIPASFLHNFFCNCWSYARKSAKNVNDNAKKQARDNAPPGVKDTISSMF